MEKMTLIESFIMGKHARGEVPACILLEMTGECFCQSKRGECLGSCTYCYSSSKKGTGGVLSTERVRGLLREIREIGIEGIFWQGGDPLLHPDLFELMAYNRELGSEELLRIGSGDSRGCCQNYFVVKDDGDVIPCTFFQQMVVGNIYRESLPEIFRRSREALLFDFPVQGPCGSCQNSDVCFGCRTHAYLYTGNLRGSDPKC